MQHPLNLKWVGVVCACALGVLLKNDSTATMQEATPRENPGVTLGWLYIVIQHKVLAKLQQTQTTTRLLYILYTHTQLMLTGLPLFCHYCHYCFFYNKINRKVLRGIKARPESKISQRHIHRKVFNIKHSNCTYCFVITI